MKAQTYRIGNIINSDHDFWDVKASILKGEEEIGTVIDYGDNADLDIKFHKDDDAAAFQDYARAEGHTIQALVLRLIEQAIDEE